MDTPQNPPDNIERKLDQLEELKTDSPLSEKDEVKAAERKTAKLHTKIAQLKKK